MICACDLSHLYLLTFVLGLFSSWSRWSLCINRTCGTINAHTHTHTHIHNHTICAFDLPHSFFAGPYFFLPIDSPIALFAPVHRDRGANWFRLSSLTIVLVWAVGEARHVRTQRQSCKCSRLSHLTGFFLWALFYCTHPRWVLLPSTVRIIHTPTGCPIWDSEIECSLSFSMDSFIFRNALTIALI